MDPSIVIGDSGQILFHSFNMLFTDKATCPVFQNNCMFIVSSKNTVSSKLIQLENLTMLLAAVALYYRTIDLGKGYKILRMCEGLSIAND